MDSDKTKTEWGQRACALVANRIVKEYTTLLKMGIGVEIESFVEKRIENIVDNANCEFKNQVMKYIMIHLSSKV